MEDLEDQKFTNLKFIELNACNGGCIGGVLTVENPYVAEVKLKRLRKYMPVARSHMEEQAETCIPWTTKVQFEPVFRLGDNMLESFSRLEQVEPVAPDFRDWTVVPAEHRPVKHWQRILYGEKPVKKTAYII